MTFAARGSNTYRALIAETRSRTLVPPILIRFQIGGAHLSDSALCRRFAKGRSQSTKPAQRTLVAALIMAVPFLTGAASLPELRSPQQRLAQIWALLCCGDMYNCE